MNRREQISILLEKINQNHNGKFMVCGSAGMGKTTFLKMLEYELKSQGKKVVWVQRFPSPMWEQRYDRTKLVYLIDDLDKAYYQKHLVNYIAKTNICCICTSRKNVWDLDLELKILLESLSNDDMLTLISDRLGSYNLKNDTLEKILTQIRNEGGNTPGYAVHVINSYFREAGLQNGLNESSMQHNCQSYILGKGIDLTCPKILLPEHNSIVLPNEVKNDVNVISQSLLSRISNDYEELYRLTPRQFEEMVCELFERNGYEVTLTKQTRDGGKDIIVTNRSMFGDFVFYVECKRYGLDKPVSVHLVKQLYGTVLADRVNAGVFITSSFYTSPAHRFAKSVHKQLSLMDYNDLINAMQNTNILV